METEGDAGNLGDRVYDVDTLGQQTFGVHPAIGEVLAPALRVAQHPEFGGVDLDVLASERRQFLRLGAHDLGRVGEQFEGVRIGVARMFGRPAQRHHQRTRQA